MKDHGDGSRLVFSTGGGDTRKKTAAPRAGGHAPTAAAATGGKGIRVRLEKRPGGRSITVVLGLQGGEDALLALARDLRAACGAGGTLREGVVELQGDQVDKARAFLAARGLKAR
jgi:translation initiation factor 1